MFCNAFGAFCGFGEDKVANNAILITYILTKASTLMFTIEVTNTLHKHIREREKISQHIVFLAACLKVIFILKPRVIFMVRITALSLMY